MTHVPGYLPDYFLAEMRELERVYLTQDDPIKQSGFYGGAERWRRVPRSAASPPASTDRPGFALSQWRGFATCADRRGA
jgi:hypothetical protein